MPVKSLVSKTIASVEMQETAPQTASNARKRPSRRLRVVHTSDVHLETDTFGAGPRGEELRRRVRQAFASVVELANARHADLLLIVGDLFDSARVSEEGLAFALDTIGKARMPVVMIPGNHDAHDERSIYAPLPRTVLPSNLHLILEPEGVTIDLPAISTRLWGRALVEHTPEYRPLFGMPAPAPDMWNIGLAHGFFMEDGDSYRSSPITAAEIADSRYDYIALGHVHVWNDVSQGDTRAFYCGTPAPLYSGDHSGWVAWVECDPDGKVSVERVLVPSPDYQSG